MQNTIQLAVRNQVNTPFLPLPLKKSCRNLHRGNIFLNYIQRLGAIKKISIELPIGHQFVQRKSLT